MCQYIILASFFPELLASNIVEFAPLMNMGRDIVMNDGYLDARLIRSACYQCQLCQKYLPGRYPAKYHPLIVSLAEGGEKFPEESDDMSCYSDIARAYEKIILMDGISRKTVILANSVVRSILANSISARAQNVWSDDPDLDLPLDEYSYRLVVFDETVINDFNVHTLPRLVVPGKSRMNDMNVRAKLWSDETAKNYWSPTGSMSMFFSYIGWYTTDPRVIFDDENTHRLRYALASIATCGSRNVRIQGDSKVPLPRSIVDNPAFLLPQQLPSYDTKGSSQRIG
jgi:hypothetical protein